MLSPKTSILAYLSALSAMMLITIASTPAAASTVQPEAEQNIPEVVELTPQEAVRAFSIQYGADPTLAHCIVANESGFRADARNPGSSAGGIWQFIDGTWASTVKRMGKDWSMEDKYDMLKNAEAGAWLLAHDGYTHWVVWPKCV